MSNVYLTVILPSYNEMRNIRAGVLGKVYEYLKVQDYTWELILSDDGSTDGTTEALLDFAKGKKGVSVLQNKHGGKGPTVLNALSEANGDYSLFTDFDQATPLSEVEKLLDQVKRGFEIVIGSREIEGAQRQKEPIHRHIMGKGFNFFVQLLTIRGIKDTQCGFKLFSKKSLKLLLPKVVVYGGRAQEGAYTGAFDVELLFIARKYKISIAEVPVNWKYVKTQRVDPIKDSVRMLFDLFRIRLADIQGKYSGKV